MIARDHPAGPVGLLARHFFSRLFDLEFLSDRASQSLPRIVAGVAGMLIAVGLILTRVFLKRYAGLWDADTPHAWMSAVLTDHVFAIAVPMWIVAVATVTIGQSLFPDEADFRILTPLPTRRRDIFLAKILSLLAFGALFVAAAQAALIPLLVLSGIGPWATVPFPFSVAANLIAGAFGGAFAALAVAAVNALLLLLVPRHHLQTAAAAVTSLLLFGLVGGLPLVGQLPAVDRALVDQGRWLFFYPPAWFLGIERTLLGEWQHAPLAAAAVGALVVTGAITAGAFLILYRHFDRILLRSAPAAPSGSTARPIRIRRTTRPARAAIRAFAFLTLGRSVFHQGVVVTIAAVGAAIALSSLLNANFEATRPWGRWVVVQTVTWVPMMLIFVMTMAVRTALLVPIDLRANWVLRMTEDPRHRFDALEGAGSVLRLLGVALPVALLFPIQWRVFAAGGLVTSAAFLVAGLLLVELVLLGWRRLPFTCSYIVGKRTAPLILIRGFLVFAAFTELAAAAARQSVAGGPGNGLIIIGLLGAVVIALRRLRQHLRESEPLEFEDTLPTEANPLRLSEY